jgi:hypothetical protein
MILEILVGIVADERRECNGKPCERLSIALMTFEKEM